MEAKGKMENLWYDLELYALFVTNQVSKHLVTFGPHMFQQLSSAKAGEMPFFGWNANFSARKLRPSGNI